MLESLLGALTAFLIALGANLCAEIATRREANNYAASRWIVVRGVTVRATYWASARLHIASYAESYEQDAPAALSIHSDTERAAFWFDAGRKATGNLSLRLFFGANGSMALYCLILVFLVFIPAQLLSRLLNLNEPSILTLGIILYAMIAIYFAAAIAGAGMCIALNRNVEFPTMIFGAFMVVSVTPQAHLYPLSTAIAAGLAVTAVACGALAVHEHYTRLPSWFHKL